MLSREDSLEKLCVGSVLGMALHTCGREKSAMEKNRSQSYSMLPGPRAVRASRSLPVDTISLQMSPRFGDMPWITAFIGSGGLGLFHCQAQKQTAKQKQH